MQPSVRPALADRVWTKPLSADGNCAVHSIDVARVVPPLKGIHPTCAFRPFLYMPSRGTLSYENICALVSLPPPRRPIASLTACYPPLYASGPGHSLGAGTAILLKIILARNAVGVLKGGAYGKDDDKAPLSARLDVGRPVRVECYAFAPPPVFSAPGADWMRDVYSFVNG